MENKRQKRKKNPLTLGIPPIQLNQSDSPSNRINSCSRLLSKRLMPNHRYFYKYCSCFRRKKGRSTSFTMERNLIWSFNRMNLLRLRKAGVITLNIRKRVHKFSVDFFKNKSSCFIFAVYTLHSINICKWKSSYQNS